MVSVRRTGISFENSGKSIRFGELDILNDS